VVASFDVPAEKMPGGRALVSKVLVQNVEVLAVEEKTIYTSETPSSTGGMFGGGAAPVQRRERSTELVTLLTDVAQAQALRLAMQHGTVSLAMRNPTDQTMPEAKVTIISDLVGTFGSASPTPGTPGPAVTPGSTPVFMGEAGARVGPSETKPVQAEKPATPRWTVEVLHGSVSETQSFDLPPIKSGPAGK
jgi:Flp pilus assembly protein CpaB